MKILPRLVVGSGAAIALIASACGSNSSKLGVQPHPSIIEVAPTEFLRELECAQGPGAMRRYIATLIDETQDAGTAQLGFELPSSDLVSCERSVAFGWIATDAQYRAVIAGYDREDIEVLVPGLTWERPESCDAETPSALCRTPIVVDSVTRERVSPRWMTSCGPVRAEANLTRAARPCEPWTNNGPLDPTQVEVFIDDALGDTVCGGRGTNIERFVVRRNGEEIGSAQCGDSVLIDHLQEGEFVQVDVLAFAADSNSPILGGVCSAIAKMGTTLAASCDLFESRGALFVDLSDVLGAASAHCDSSLSHLFLYAPELAETTEPNEIPEPLQFTGANCSGTAQFASLEPGNYSLKGRVTVNGSAGDAIEVSCSGTVEPGLRTRARCSKL